MSRKKEIRQILVCLLTIFIISSCSSNSSTNPISSLRETTENENLVESYLGTLDGKVLSTINFTSGDVDIHGVGVLLDNGESIDAVLTTGVIDVIIKGIRVKVIPVDLPEFEWQVIEIVSGGVETPDISKTAEAYAQRCILNGAVLDSGSSDFVNSLDILSELLTEKLDCEVNIFIVSPGMDLLTVIFDAGEADFAITYFSQFLLARDFINATPILIAAYNDTDPYHRGAFIIRSDSNVESLADFEGKIFAFTNVGHNYGYHMPRVMLEQDGFNPNNFFSETISYGYSPNEIISALVKGDADIGIVWATEDGDALNVAQDALPDVLDQVKILNYTPWIPNDVIIASDFLSEEIKKELTDGLLEFIDEVDGGNALYNSFSFTSLEEPDNRFWDAIDLLNFARQLDVELGEWE